jgi:hypothetical protein
MAFHMKTLSARDICPPQNGLNYVLPAFRQAYQANKCFLFSFLPFLFLVLQPLTAVYEISSESIQRRMFIDVWDFAKLIFSLRRFFMKNLLPQPHTPPQPPHCLLINILASLKRSPLPSFRGSELFFCATIIYVICESITVTAT